MDQKNNEEDDDPPGDGDWAYGPSRTHALVAENPGKCTTNADNYAWLATVRLVPSSSIFTEAQHEFPWYLLLSIDILFWAVWPVHRFFFNGKENPH